jgi:hypothetical protein
VGAGVAGIPHCNASRAICDEVDKLLQLGAYNPFVQKHLAQVTWCCIQSAQT